MNGPEHYAEAERIIAGIATGPTSGALIDYSVGIAQVHATLALAAATVEAAPSSHARDVWGDVLGISKPEDAR